MRKILIAVCSLLIAIYAMVATADIGAFDMNRWYTILTNIQTRALSEKISPDTINSVVQHGIIAPDVMATDAAQAPGTKIDLEQYISSRATPQRVADGRKMAAKYKTLLAHVSQKYGVPAHVILALWCVETNYGTYMQTHQISDAYLTLIYQGRREEFFTNQLISLMHVADDDNMKITDLRGSWAGAMGHFQFMPTTLLAYGMDGDADGKIDIINDIADAMYSAGNYLSKLGWDNTQKIARSAFVPADFDWTLCDGKTKHTLAEWSQLGITNRDGTALPMVDMTAGIVCDVPPSAAPVIPQADGQTANPIVVGGGAKGDAVGGVISSQTPVPAYLTYDNFYRLRRWNNSNSFAALVATLSEMIKQ